jgi:hypothetical protein
MGRSEITRRRLLPVLVDELTVCTKVGISVRRQVRASALRTRPARRDRLGQTGRRRAVRRARTTGPTPRPHADHEIRKRPGNTLGPSTGATCRDEPSRLYQAPRSWTEQAYPNLIYFNEVGKGNHFAAWQEPNLFTTEVRAAFPSLR